jgi:hypothetical protein
MKSGKTAPDRRFKKRKRKKEREEKNKFKTMLK